VLTRVPWLSGFPQAVGCRDKEMLSSNGMQQGSRVSKTRPRITVVPARRRYHDLQIMRTGATAPRYSASPCGKTRQDAANDPSLMVAYRMGAGHPRSVPQGRQRILVSVHHHQQVH
jgi:hypothetical protein